MLFPSVWTAPEFASFAFAISRLIVGPLYVLHGQSKALERNSVSPVGLPQGLPQGSCDESAKSDPIPPSRAKTWRQKSTNPTPCLRMSPESPHPPDAWPLVSALYRKTICVHLVVHSTYPSFPPSCPETLW